MSLSESVAPPPAVADVFITEELERRTPGHTDYLQEKLALQDIAQQMSDHPEEVLPRLVAQAMELCGADAAGISLFEPQPDSPGIFRWHYLTGTLAAFNGGTTPRNFSPCGIVLDERRAILVQAPERLYTWLSDAGIALPEVLLVPLYIGGTEPLGTLWVVAPEGRKFDSGDARVMTELAAFAGLALRMVQSEQRLHQALEHQQRLTDEMSHRIKNLFAITSGMISVSAREADTPRELAQILSGRLNALARAHAVVRTSFGEGDPVPKTGDLKALVETILEPHAAGIGESGQRRFTAAGPQVRLGERTVNGLALVLHEWATNAAKYGALQTTGGSVRVTWDATPDRLVLSWREQGGPQITSAPSTEGFGTTLTRRTVTGDLGGTIAYDWQPDGLAISVDIPTDRLKR